MVEEVGGRRILKGTSEPLKISSSFLSHSYSRLQAGLKLSSTCLQVNLLSVCSLLHSFSPHIVPTFIQSSVRTRLPRCVTQQLLVIPQLHQTRPASMPQNLRPMSPCPLLRSLPQLLRSSTPPSMSLLQQAPMVTLLLAAVLRLHRKWAIMVSTSTLSIGSLVSCFSFTSSSLPSLYSPTYAGKTLFLLLLHVTFLWKNVRIS